LQTADSVVSPAAGLGVSLIPSDATTPEQALRKADLALYRAKEERRSAVHFFDEGTDRRVQTGLPPERLEIEITESTLVRNLDATQNILGGLREAGIRIALDNFGTGYSNLYHLRNLKIDKIKIDSGFIHGMLFEQEDAGIVRALVGLARGLGITIAADGIEDSAQQASLIKSGCKQGQGRFYCDPVSAERTQSVIEGALLPYRVA
jgi:predicted signal transduction protein with EAL and GGDEF domain